MSPKECKLFPERFSSLKNGISKMGNALIEQFAKLRIRTVLGSLSIFFRDASSNGLNERSRDLTFTKMFRFGATEVILFSAK